MENSLNKLISCSEESSEYRLRQIFENENIDIKFGFEKPKNLEERTGFLLNMHSVSSVKIFVPFEKTLTNQLSYEITKSNFIIDRSH